MSAPPWVVLPLGLGLILVFARLARNRPTLSPLAAPFALSVLASSALATLGYEGLPSSGPLSLLVLVPALVLLVRGLGILLQGIFLRRQGHDAPALLESVVAVILYGVGTVVIAHRWFGVELTPVLATSAVVGAVVGLALQDTLGNLFSGIALHLDAPFRVGDWVKVGESEGRVEQISWRAVRLRTWSRDAITIPNNEVAQHAVVSYASPGQPHSRVLGIGVNYHTPPNKVMTVLLALLDQVQVVLKDPPPQLRIVGYGDFAIQYEIRYYFEKYEHYRAAEGEIHRLIWYYFRRHGIEIPFPVRNVYLHDAAAQDLRESTTGRLERALREIDMFRPLSDDELRSAAAAFRHLHYSTGEKIIEEGNPGDSFFVIDRGEVDVFKTIAGKSRALARLMEGQCFGEMALLTGERRSATVVAATDVDVFTLDKQGFQKILVPNPAIAVEISSLLAQRRDALSQAEDDVTAPFHTDDVMGDRKQRILDRIRSYFGL
jgi:small-conductance mechanosensitive channel/CRP-like cAMP-binding protein